MVIVLMQYGITCHKVIKEKTLIAKLNFLQDSCRTVKRVQKKTETVGELKKIPGKFNFMLIFCWNLRVLGNSKTLWFSFSGPFECLIPNYNCKPCLAAFFLTLPHNGRIEGVALVEWLNRVEINPSFLLSLFQMQNLDSIILFPVDRLLKNELRGSKGDLKRPFDRAWKDYNDKFSELERQKKKQAKEAGKKVYKSKHVWACLSKFWLIN